MAAGDVTVLGSVIPDSDRSTGDYVLIWGKVVLDGTNPTPVALAEYVQAVDFAVANVVASAPVADDLNTVCVNVSTTTLNIEVYKNTATDNPTYTDSTNNSAEVMWFAAGPKK